MNENTNRVDRIVLVLLCLSLGVNVWLASGTSLLKRFKGYDSQEYAGRAVGELAVQTLAGEDSVLRFDGQKTILYVMSPHCVWCARNSETITALWRGQKSQYRFVAISLLRNDLDEYLKTHPILFDVFVLKEGQDQSLETLGFSGTPMTAVISTTGLVERSWRGSLGAEVGRDARRFFKLDLPEPRVN